jgi:hypothetical protein
MKGENLRMRDELGQRSIEVVDRMAASEDVNLLLQQTLSPGAPLRRRDGITRQSTKGRRSLSPPGMSSTVSRTDSTIISTSSLGDPESNQPNSSSDDAAFEDSLARGIEAHRRTNNSFRRSLSRREDVSDVLSRGTRSSSMDSFLVPGQESTEGEVRDPAMPDNDVLSGVTSVEYAGFGVSPTVKSALGGTDKTKTHGQRFFHASNTQLRLPLGKMSSEASASRLLGINAPNFSTTTPLPATSPRKNRSLLVTISSPPNAKQDVATSSAFKQPAPTFESALATVHALEGHHSPTVGRGNKSAFARTNPTDAGEQRWTASRGGPSDPDPLRAKTATILDRDGRPTIESVRDDPTLADDFAAAAAQFDREQRAVLERLSASAEVTAPPPGSDYVWNPYSFHQLAGPGVLRWGAKPVSSREGTRLAPRRHPLPRSPPLTLQTSSSASVFSDSSTKDSPSARSSSTTARTEAFQRSYSPALGGTRS